jgi:hypothetical protein
MFTLDQNNQNDLVKSNLNFNNLLEKKMVSYLTRQKTLEEFWKSM